jgi:integrase/recombinase XerD
VLPRGYSEVRKNIDNSVQLKKKDNNPEGEAGEQAPGVTRRQKTEDRRQKTEGRGRKTSDAAWLSRAKVIDTAMKPPCTGSLTRTATRGGIRRIWISIQRRSGSNTTWKSSGYAASTIECYSVYLGYFLDYLRNKVMDLKQVTHETIRSYQLLVMDMDIAEETKGMRLRPVKRLFGWLLDTHRLLLDPTENIRETSRQNRTVPEVLTVAEMRLLLEQPNLSLRMQIRDRAIMETLYSSGIRLNELVQLTVHDVDLKDKVLHIRKGKGNRQRVVPIGKNAATYLQEYLENIRPRYARKNKQQRRLFLTDQGRPVTGNSIRTSLFHYKKAAGITKTASPHSFRRSCATHLLQQGADIRYVQKLLGHRHIRTTQIYTRVYPIDLKETHTRTHPPC